VSARREGHTARAESSNGSCGAGCQCGAPAKPLGGVRCCVRNSGCLSRGCHFGVGCPLGIKCCRQAPKLLDLRSRLLAGLCEVLPLPRTGTAA
jgi:hypothetical protein